MNKLVSVIIPVYNVEKYLVRCLDSVRAQTYQNMEIILIDDGSQDSSAVLCDCFQKIDNRIRVIHKENGGLSSARNAGLDVATGTYVYFLDSDDYIEPQLLEKVVFALENTESDWCGFWAWREDIRGHVKYRISFETDQWDLADDEERISFLLGIFLNYHIGWEACFHIYRRDIIENNSLRFYSERIVFAEDLLFSFCYLLYAKRGLCIPEVFYHYVEREESLMGKKAEVNVLPPIQNMSDMAYENVCRSGNRLLKEKFGLINMALLEWHARKYINMYGIDWVKKCLQQMDCKKYLPVDKKYMDKLYQDGIAAYGRVAGVISVILPVETEEDEKASEQYINSILNQTIQRLDILILRKIRKKRDYADCRIRLLQIHDFSENEVMRLGFQESFGEYIFFADIRKPPVCTFLESVTDAMKYNYCDTGVEVRDSAGTFVYNHKDPECRKDIRKKLKENNNPMIFRTDLLQKSGLEHMRDLYRYRTEMILSGDVIFLGMKKEMIV